MWTSTYFPKRHGDSLHRFTSRSNENMLGASLDEYLELIFGKSWYLLRWFLPVLLVKREILI